MSKELDDLGASILKAFGDGFTSRNATMRYFDTGFPPLNRIISGSYSGGIPSGRIIEIFGPSQSGKTHLATEIMRSVQEQGGAAIFLDHEKRFKPEFAERRGLNLKAPHFFYQLPWTWEEAHTKAIMIAEALRGSDAFPKDAPIVAVLDSVASANPRSKVGDKGATGKDAMKAKEMEFNMSDMTALARATSAVLPVMAGFCDKLDLTMIYLNQTREKPGVMYGDPTTTPGGKSLHFYADVRVQLGRSLDKEGKEYVGQTVSAKAIKAVTAPFKTTHWSLTYDDDGDTLFDKESSLVEHLVEVGAIPSAKKQGSVIFDNTTYTKKALIEAVKTMPDGYNILLKMLP